MENDGIKCEVLFPHCRELNGQLMMLEPMFSGVLNLPDDDETRACIEAGWLRVLEPEGGTKGNST